MSMITCMSSVVFVITTNLIALTVWQDYHHLSESDQTALYFAAVAWGVFAIILNVLCITAVSSSLFCTILLVFINIGLIAVYQFFVWTVIKDNNTESADLSNDQSEDSSHDHCLIISTKTVNELLLMKHIDDGGGH